MHSRICLSCDRKNAPDAKFCSECGAPLLLKICRHCQKTNDHAANFCQSCGKALPFVDLDSPPAEQPTSGATPAPMPPGSAHKGAAAAAREATPVRSDPGASTIVKAFSPPAAAEAPTSAATAVRDAVEDVTAQPVTATVADAAEATGYALPVVVARPLASPTGRQGTRGAWLALGALVVVAAIGAVTLVGRHPGTEMPPVPPAPRATTSDVATPPPAARDAAAVAATAPPPSGSGESAAPQAQSPALPPDPQTETKDTDPPTPARRAQPAAAETVPPSRPLPAPRPAPARECTADLAILGLCTLPDQPERK
jgi:ribosomal protein L40E